MTRLTEPSSSIKEVADLVRYLNQLVRDLVGNLENVRSDLYVTNKRLTMANQTIDTDGANIDPGSSVVLVDASVSSITVNLPDPYEVNGRAYWVKRIDSNPSNDVTIDCVTSGVLIESSATDSIPGSNIVSHMYYSDGTSYWSLADSQS